MFPHPFPPPAPATPHLLCPRAVPAGPAAPMRWTAALSILLPLLLAGPAPAQAPSEPGSWARKPGPAGGTVKYLVSEGADLYAGLEGSGVFRLPGGIGTWQPMQDGLPGRNLAGLASAQGGLWALSGGRPYRRSRTDQSWKAVAAFPGKVGLSLHVDDSLILIGTDSSVFRSRDGGATWTETWVKEFSYIWCFAGLGTDLFAGSENGAGVFRSRDGGRTWQGASSGLPLDKGIAVYALLGHGDRIFAATTEGLFASADTGSHWQSTASIPEGTDFSFLAHSGSTVYAGGRGPRIWLSSDLGANWTFWEAPAAAGGIEILFPFGREFWIGTREGGAWRRPTGESVWHEANAGLQGVDFERLACAGDNLAGMWRDRLFISLDSGETWKAIPAKAGDRVNRGIAFHHGRLYAGFEDGLWSLDPFSADPKLALEHSAGIDGLASMGDSLVLDRWNGGPALWDESAGPQSPLPDFAASIPSGLFAGEPGLLRGFDRYGKYWEYRSGDDAAKEWASPDFEPQSLAVIGGVPVLITESREAYGMHPQGDSARPAPFALPFTAVSLCRDGNGVWAAAAGEGLALYPASGTVRLAPPRRPSDGAAEKRAFPSRRGVSPLFASPDGSRRDANGKRRLR